MHGLWHIIQGGAASLGTGRGTPGRGRQCLLRRREHSRRAGHHLHLCQGALLGCGRVSALTGPSRVPSTGNATGCEERVGETRERRLFAGCRPLDYLWRRRRAARKRSEAPSRINVPGHGTNEVPLKKIGSTEKATVPPRLSQSAKDPVPGVPVKQR